MFNPEILEENQRIPFSAFWTHRKMWTKSMMVMHGPLSLKKSFHMEGSHNFVIFLFLNASVLCYSLIMRDNISHLYILTEKIVVLYILIFMFVEW